MKTTLFTLLLTFSIALLSLSASAQGNHYYSSPTLHDPYGRFQMNFPGEPTYNYQDTPSEVGMLRMYNFMLETESAVYMVSYVDYPSSHIAGQDMEALLKRAAGGFINSLKLTSKSESIINYGNYKGILFYADNGEWYAVMRDFIVGNRLYQMGILSTGEIDVNTENEFFDSFVLK